MLRYDLVFVLEPTSYFTSSSLSEVTENIMNTDAPDQTVSKASATGPGEPEHPKLPKTSSPPTSFLSLPHELRQQILLYTNEVPLLEPDARLVSETLYFTLLATISKSFEDCIMRRRLVLEQVDPAVVGDVYYVCRVWESRRRKVHAENLPRRQESYNRRKRKK